MDTMDITPRPEFLEAYKRVCGAYADTGPRGVIPAIRNPRLASRIHEELAKIMNAKASDKRPPEACVTPFRF